MSEYTPQYKVTCDGNDITEAISKRLLTLRVHDEAGFKNDRMELTLDNCKPFISLPNRGAKFEVFMGYKETGMRQMGVYEFDEGVQFGPPHSVTYVAHAKDTNAGFKGSKQRSWHGKSVQEIVQDIASANGFQAKVDGSVGGTKVDHIDQTTQSDMGFLTDLARTNNAVMKIVNGSVYFAPKNQTKSVDGGGVLNVVIPFEKVSGYSHNFQGRGNYEGVRGRYWDREEAKEKYSGAGNPDGDNVHTLPEIYNDKSAAEAAAKSLFGEMSRSMDTLELRMPGMAEIMAESSLSITGDFPPTIPTSWLVDKAEHTMSPGGYQTTAVCVQPGRGSTTFGGSGGSGGGGGGSGGEGGSDGGAGGGEKEEPRDNKEGGGNDGYQVTEQAEET